MTVEEEFPLGATVCLISGGRSMTVLSHSEQELEGRKVAFVHCCWHTEHGHPIAAAYPSHVLLREH